MNLWNTSNRILFKDLAYDDAKAYINSKNTILKPSIASVESIYEIEVIPKIPIINEIEFHLADTNNNFSLVDSISQLKSAVLTSKVGISQIFKLKLKFADNYSVLKDIELFEASCVPISELNLSKLNASILTDIVEGICFVRIDSSGVCLDTLINCLEVNCILEIKYTNKLGRKDNLSHCFRKQFMISFEQIVYSSVYSIKEIE